MNQWVEYTGTWNTTVEWNQAILFRWKFGGDSSGYDVEVIMKEEDRRSYYKLNELSWWESSPQLKTAFVHDVMERLMYILTGEKQLFYSKFFGRTGTALNYEQTGFGGLISLISGFWLRAFDPTTDKYKSLTTSLKIMFDDLKSVFNVGIGIQSDVLGEYLRIEDLKYFYQNEVVVKLPYPVSNSERKVDAGLFFSGLHFGYEFGSDYEDSNGLDEPNTSTDWVTSIRKSENKYERKSKTRADDYAMELTRRKPQNLYPEEDTQRDSNNWFLDLKIPTPAGIGYVQTNWADRLEKEPTGIFDPDSWHSFLFTPLQMLFRHAWIFRGGLEPYLENRFKVKHTRSTSNSNVSTQFIGKKEYKQSDDILNSDLERSRFLPEEITFEHVVDDELMDLVLGTTPIMVGGELENVPNYYFKFEWVRDGITERGYLMNLKPKGKGVWTFQKANENLI